MAITTQTGKVVVDTNLIPYIRGREVEFLAYNMKPYKTARMFFDDVAVNGFCQSSNKVVIDAKKALKYTDSRSVSSGANTTITQNDYLYQGDSYTSNTFVAIIESSIADELILRNISGMFNEGAQVYAANANTKIAYARANVVSINDTVTADVFYPGEGVISLLTNSYASVLATSGPNIVYLKQNYLNLNIAAVAGTLAVAANSYSPGDIVYQTSDSAQRYDRATFRGIMKYINAQGMIAIEPIYGEFEANSSSSYIWNASNTSAPAVNATSYIGTSFYSTNTSVIPFIRSIQNTSTANCRVLSYKHSSGVIANNNSDSTTIILNNLDNSGTINGNLIYFCSGTGVGESRSIVGTSTVANTTVVSLGGALTFTPDATTRYSIGNQIVDEYGAVSGLFHIPSFPGFKFKTGNRIFTITDTVRYNDPDFGMRAAATYAASGILQTTQRIQTTPVLSPLPETDGNSAVAPSSPSDRPATGTPVKPPVTGSTASTIPRIPLGDGMAQTFFVPKPKSNKQDYGLYCTSIDLFFKSKPSLATYEKNSVTLTRGSLQLPVTVRIAEVENGYPTKKYLASKSVNTKDVKVSSLPSINDPTTSTKFTFDDPVFLEPNREYAILVGSDSPDYELFIAELGADVLGTGTTSIVRISEQPYAGSFFRSQNSTTWTPYQNQDLMFVLNKAVFDSSGSVTFNLDAPPVANIDIDRVMLTSTDLSFPVGLIDYKMKGVYSATLDRETIGVDLEPNRPVEFGTLLDKSAKNSINRRKLIQGNANSVLLTVDMSSSDSDISPILNLERLAITAATFSINNAGLSNTKIAITNYGTGYTNTPNIVVGSSNNTVNTAALAFKSAYFPNPTYNIGLYAITISGGGGSGAAGFAVANTDGANKINAIVLTHMGSGYVTTPTVAVNAPTNPTGNVTATAVVSGEDGKSGGNILAKYVTREIVLEDGFESGDLRVFMDAIRPTGTDVLVYYKVRSGDDPETIGDKSWKLMSKVKDVYSRNTNTFIGLEYRPSLDENKINYIENGVSYPIGGTFKHFQIKVCMITSDQSLIPRVKNLRITAVPEG